MNQEEKIFVTLRKLDWLWSKNKRKNFCDIWKDLNGGEMRYLTDDELVEKLKDVNIEK